MKDQFGNEIKVGDVVRCTMRDAGRGAYLWLTQSKLDVVGLGRSRVKVTSLSFNGVASVGSECLRIVEPVDGRKLISADEAWAIVRANIAERSLTAG